MAISLTWRATDASIQSPSSVTTSSNGSLKRYRDSIKRGQRKPSNAASTTDAIQTEMFSAPFFLESYAARKL